ncbi:CBASS cGAMP synthase [Rhizobium sp. ZPR3]|uniref:Cyclic GMP-AMP synthase n=2 Tax=unclassified Rhizobium TaxID=2613769 RepID=A0AAU7SPI5_9HYPH
MANVSKLLHNTVDDNYLANLKADETSLRNARTKIRERLRDAFARSSAEIFGVPVRPKFFTQGSFAYKTLNLPAFPPDQQKDLDDGCYLPLSFVRGERPSQAASAFFAFVETALAGLAEEEGWVLIKEKATCVRLVISRDGHIDIPLYAIPDGDFQHLEEARNVQKMHTADAKIDSWDALPSDAVLLAHREKDWVESDPRKIHDWFIDAVDLYKERLRHDSRYMKAWRDHHRLDEDGLTSINIMACVWKAYEAIRGPFLPDRADERLLRVVEKIQMYLVDDVRIPPCGDENINRMTATERKRVIGKLQELEASLREIVTKCDNENRAIELLRAGFGPRVPFRPDLVIIQATPAVTVLSEPKKKVPAPEVGRSISG